MNILAIYIYIGIYIYPLTLKIFCCHVFIVFFIMKIIFDYIHSRVPLCCQCWSSDGSLSSMNWAPCHCLWRTKFMQLTAGWSLMNRNSRSTGKRSVILDWSWIKLAVAFAQQQCLESAVWYYSKNENRVKLSWIRFDSKLHNFNFFGRQQDRSEKWSNIREAMVPFEVWWLISLLLISLCPLQFFFQCNLSKAKYKGLFHELDFKKFDKNFQNLA